MSRETCIQHRPHNRLAIVREDYFDLTGDAVAAALLNYFEYRANSALAPETEPENMSSVGIGPISIAEFQTSLLGLSTDKQIRRRLSYLRDQGAISCPDTRQGKTPNYTVEVSRIQRMLHGSESVEKFGQTTSVKQPRSNNLGQITEPLRSNDQSNLGQITEPLRSNDQYSLYKNKEVDQSVRARPQKNAIPSDIQRFESQFIPETTMPWIIKPHRYNPEIDPRMMAGVKAHLDKYDQPSQPVDVKRWILAADESSPKGTQRTQAAYLIWDSVSTAPTPAVQPRKLQTIDTIDDPAEYQRRVWMQQGA
jgi:hypothetical protein